MADLHKPTEVSLITLKSLSLVSLTAQDNPVGQNHPYWFFPCLRKSCNHVCDDVLLCLYNVCIFLLIVLCFAVTHVHCLSQLVSRFPFKAGILRAFEWESCDWIPEARACRKIRYSGCGGNIRPWIELFNSLSRYGLCSICQHLVF